jgi:hypothetical protein
MVASYGNLYFANDACQKCEKLKLVGNGVESIRKEVEEQFVIGPASEVDFWRHERSDLDIDRGPCKSFFSTSIRS